ncbi:translation initiation factor IF-1 [Candidatus Phytoplasma melaleucae]|uniref:Translation initiation factor IF-1 n=1 Tax=Candidatus Phytoplasma melaleucae TaxID=2982630 RepID=A0ABT9DDJ4_9MOLU|nr:translation initiation factor IF-1 ['Melaleuca sp.' phytoplasma]MDO8168105.1 translation initiation factor IF-1 ['Melaleuca sp.' phytoplasma]MDV3205267.1 translation initiation factor IF-1 [Weeping tea tree witches'-broom phytoplasma]
MAHEAELLTFDARVIEILPGEKFKLKLLDDKNNHEDIIARISGKIRINNIRIILGDKVRVDCNKRIIYRYNTRKGETT